jgi:hypothetical protein
MKLMNRANILQALCTVLVLLAASVALADSGEAENAYAANTAGGFIGGTGSGRRDNGLTLALTYERRFSESFGLGAEVERVFGDLDFWLATIPFSYHFGEWKVFAGPGVEKLDGGDTEILLRIGGEYSIEISDSWEMSPTVALDFVDDDQEIIVGVLFGYGF